MNMKKAKVMLSNQLATQQTVIRNETLEGREKCTCQGQTNSASLVHEKGNSVSEQERNEALLVNSDIMKNKLTTPTRQKCTLYPASPDTRCSNSAPHKSKKA